jgi:methionyl-tRNA formyltransferase
MKILFLGSGNSKELAEWLAAQGEEIVYVEEKIDGEFARRLRPEMIISYNYRHILKKDVLCIPGKGTINLHISYLPWNRGAYPNVWSFIDDTPKGVTIHLIDEGIDTGNILLQKEVYIDEERETLKTSYELLHREIEELFKSNWAKIKAGAIKPSPQQGEGTIHYVKDSLLFEHLIKKSGWDTPVRELKGKSGSIGHKH